MSKTLPGVLATLLLILPLSTALAADTTVQLGTGDNFVVQDSGATPRLIVNETTGQVQIGDAVIGGTPQQGDVWYDNGTTMTRLPPGPAGQFLQTRGAGANPQWAAQSTPPTDNQYVPFKVEVAGGTCNTAAAGSANPLVTIDSDGVDGAFTVTGILMKTSDIPATGFAFLSINYLTVDGTLFDTRTANLTGNAGGSGVLESFDIMGTPVRLTGNLNDHTPGANFPHQIVAHSEGINDVSIQFFYRTDTVDLDILFVTVSGWKRAADTITVNYIPGN